MARQRAAALIAAFIAFAAPPAQAAPARPVALSSLDAARAHLAVNDPMGFRILVKKLYWKRLTYGEWYGIKLLINANAHNAGFDLIHLWNVRNAPGKSNLDKTLEYADSLMLKGHFSQAFVEYQKMADYLRKLKSYLKAQKGSQAEERLRDTVAIYPFVLHSMGRALYGAGRYDSALTVYSWLDPTYPRFRQILFEKMWAAFRAGRVEIALGAIASQRSAYFSSYLSPESYLLQTYIYRKLCRTQDVEQVVKEMKEYEQALRQEKAPEAWIGSDLETRVLWGLANGRPPEEAEKLAGVTAAEREKEKAEIFAAIQRSFSVQKTKLLADLKSAQAYAHLAGVSDTRQALKPIEKLTSREALSRLDLEMWPVDSAEEWMDEVGRHIFVGDSLCAGN